jgi:asparagine synthetase B (glutamine-hydrolysing)
MCGYYYSHNKIIPSGPMQNIKRRGPEGFDSLHLDNEYFGHSLLNTRGKSTTQPIQNKHGTLVYNGSTYNSAGNDTQWIAGNLDNRSSVTIELIRNLIGEYSLTYVTDTHIIFAVDQWSTKNLFFYYDQSTKTFICASAIDFVLEHAPNAVRADANKIYIINKQTFSLDILETTQWNFSQHNNNYDKLFETFEQAVKDRHEPGITTYMLSAGIDVGAIACCANKFFDIQTVSKIGKEDINVLTQRLELQKSPWIDPADDSDYIEESDKMFQQYKLDYLRSSSARALTAILQNHLLPNKQKICISGVGGDELYDDYMPDKFTHGRVGKVNGGWPSELRTIYPWHNYEGTRMAKQLHRSDTVCGHHGIEARYPLADQRVFQQWLNTTSKLKNSGYKHWLVKYLKEHNYPLTMDKTGFTSERDRIR